MKLCDSSATVVRSDHIVRVANGDDELEIELWCVGEEQSWTLTYDDAEVAERDMVNLVAAIELHDPINRPPDK